MTTAHPTIRELRKIKMDEARAALKAGNLTTTELANIINTSWETARKYINEMLLTGEVKTLTRKDPHNSMLTSIYEYVGIPGEAREIEKARPAKMHRFNPAQWCVQEDSGSSA